MKELNFLNIHNNTKSTYSQCLQYLIGESLNNFFFTEHFQLTQQATQYWKLLLTLKYHFGLHPKMRRTSEITKFLFLVVSGMSEYHSKFYNFQQSLEVSEVRLIRLCITFPKGHTLWPKVEQVVARGEKTKIFDKFNLGLRGNKHVPCYSLSPNKKFQPLPRKKQFHIWIFVLLLNIFSVSLPLPPSLCIMSFY